MLKSWFNIQDGYAVSDRRLQKHMTIEKKLNSTLDGKDDDHRLGTAAAAPCTPARPPNPLPGLFGAAFLRACRDTAQFSPPISTDPPPSLSRRTFPEPAWPLFLHPSATVCRTVLIPCTLVLSWPNSSLHLDCRGPAAER